MDLNDIRKSLDEQGWVARPGKGSHALWYPPDRSKRAVPVPMNGKRATLGRAMVNLKATLRQSGWIDPDVANRTPLPPRDPSPTDTTDTTGSEAAPEATPADPESATMPTDDDTELTVEEEDWARHSTSGKVSSSIKEQLMSDGSLRYRCAHRRGADCTFTSDNLLGVRAHSQVHRMPTLTATPKQGSTTPRPSTASRRVKDPTAPPTPAQITAQERTSRGKVAAARQVQDALERARTSGKVVREYAILPHGMGAGNPVQGVWLVASPPGKVVYECATAGCGYERATFGAVFGHRSQAHPRTGPARTNRAGASKPPGDVDEAADVQPAVSGERIDALPEGVVPALGTPIPLGPAAGDLVRPLLTALEVPVVAALSGERCTCRRPRPSPEVSVPPYREAVEYVRERMADIVDHLGAIAAGEYDRLAAAEQREAETARLQAQLEASRAQLVSQQEELDKLRDERPGLLAAQRQLDQLRTMLQQLGQVDS